MLTDELLKARQRAWRQALRELIQAHGCNKNPRFARGSDLNHLFVLSREDAEKIAQTWNRDVQHEIERLFSENPRGNRQYYFANLEAWAAQRAIWKDAQIALHTEQSTRFYAQTRFREENGLVARSQYIFVGPPPVCRICSRLFARGAVDERFIRRNPAPVHPNCPHEWEALSKPQLDCREIWVG